MEEEILAMAKSITKPAEEEESYLQTLCDAEQARLSEKLKEPLSDRRRSAFICAAAALAAADYYAGKGAGGAASWSAGDVTVHEQGGAGYGAVADNLRLVAAELMSGLLMDDGFAFLGVRG